MSASIVGLVLTLIKGGWGYLRGRQEHIDAAASARQQLQARLAGRGSSWMILIVWAIWMAPLVHAYFDPEGAKRACEALAAVPDYIRETARWLTVFGVGYPLVPRLK